jgi:HEAT repeat protein
MRVKGERNFSHMSEEILDLINSILKTENWYEATSKLCKYRNEGIKALIPHLAEKDDVRRWRVILSLCRLADSLDGITLLFEALRDPELRENAAKCLSLIIDPRIKSPALLEILLKHLSDPDKFVMMKSAEFLAEMGDERAIDPLIHALKDPTTRKRAALQLIFLGRKCTKSLVTALKNSDPELREVITEILVEIGSDALDELISALNSDIWYVRKSAVKALGEIGDVKAIPYLLKKVGDEDVDVRDAAKNAIERIRSMND